MGGPAGRLSGDAQLGAGESIHFTYVETEAKNPVAINEMLEKYGVQNVLGPTTSWRRSRRPGTRCWREQSAADPTFKKVAASYLAFREGYRAWGDAQALKATYLTK